jgi:hypothetical protein
MLGLQKPAEAALESNGWSQAGMLERWKLLMPSDESNWSKVEA